jgi:flagellar basal body rod protein FlgB
MSSPTLVITDNVTELLLKIIEFTQTRQKVLIQNINAMQTSGFVPQDLPVDEFSGQMRLALTEHVLNQRLVLCDCAHVKFGANGSFKVASIADEQAKQLLEENRDEYLRDQVSKLLENSLNQRIATELLRQRQADKQCIGRSLN